MPLPGFSPCSRSNVFTRGLIYPEVAVSSPFLSKRTIAIVRALFLVFWALATVLVIVQVAQEKNPENEEKWYQYFFKLTICSFWGLGFYLMTSLYMTLQHFKKVGYQPSPVLTTVHTWLYASMCTMVPVVVILYWLFYFKIFQNYNILDKFISVSVHGLNLVILAFEIAFSYMLIRGWQVIFVIFVVLLYFTWAILYKIWTDSWVYPFLDLENSISTYIYIAILPIFLLSFFFTYLLHKWRNLLLSKKCQTVYTEL